jgi:two-component system chemotaxis response regulator CheY
MERLLIVDDNTELLQLYRMMIPRIGHYRIAGTAGGGREAVSQYYRMEEKPDLVLMDVNMPDMDGISAARAIHRLDRDANILFVTAADIYGNDLPPELFCAMILRKPFTKSELVHYVNKAIGARKAGSSSLARM